MFELNDYIYNWLSFLIVTTVTIIPFLWVLKRTTKEKLYFISFVFFLWIYAGVGYGWSNCPNGYIWPYLLYMFTLGFTCALSDSRKPQRGRSSELSEGLSKVVKKYGKAIIIFYTFICFLQLALTGKVSNLLHPPSADLLSLMDDVTEGTNMGGTELLLYYIKSIVYVFYLVSLYIYKDDLKKLSLAILVPLYIGYANSGYIARGEVMLAVITICIAVFVKYPQYRKKFVIGALISAPFIMVLLYWYSMRRIGVELSISSINISDAMKILTYQETSYPSHYEELRKWPYNPNLTYSYLTWLVNLPLPGFMKLGDGDFAFNVLFSEKISGGLRGTEGFYVQLPGIVNESLFIFGPVFFFVHAIILGFIISKVFRLIRYDFELFLLIHLGFSVAFQLGRAGTTAAGVFPFYFKHFLIYLLVRYILINNIRKKHKNKSLV